MSINSVLCFLLFSLCLLQYNTGALQAAGGKTAGLTMTISTMQLGVCTAYALVMWIVGWNPITLCGLKMPEKQKVPAITAGDFVKTIPVGFCSAAAHSSSVFALGGDPLFGQIVKAGEPVLSAAVGLLYGKAPTATKALCLPVIVGGVAFASLKKGADGAYALKFDMTALIFGMIANAFAAIKGSENSKLMKGCKFFSALGRATMNDVVFAIFIKDTLFERYSHPEAIPPRCVDPAQRSASLS